MYHDLPRTARFWSVLLAIDHDLAEKTRKLACPRGGRLHTTNSSVSRVAPPYNFPRRSASDSDCSRLGANACEGLLGTGGRPGNPRCE